MTPDRQTELAARLEADAATLELVALYHVQEGALCDTVQEIDNHAYCANKTAQRASDLRAAAQAVRAMEWRPWPGMDDEADYPPDETDVLIYCGNWASRDMVIGRISRRSGVYGPSGASHWRPLPVPPEAAR